MAKFELAYPEFYLGNDGTNQVLSLYDLQSGELKVVAEFDKTLLGAWGGMPAGLAYDPELDCLYYTYCGELHRMMALDPATDEVIAEAPANWLYLSPAISRSFLTKDGHYMHVVPYTGVDIIDLTGK